MALLDTHALLWWTGDPSRLSARATREIAKAKQILISPVTCWELAVLVRLNRIRLEPTVHEWIAGLFEDERVAVAPLTPTAATSAGLLGPEFTGDPADRFLYATARELVVPFVCKDARIRDFALDARDVKVVW